MDGDYADLRPEPLDPETCVYRGQLYRRHEAERLLAA